MSEKLLANGIAVPLSCQSGVCGTGRIDVSEGLPGPRNLVHTDTE